MAALAALELFAGCGGTSLALRAAGIEPVTAVEASHEAVRTYRLNFPSTAVIEASAEEIHGGALPEVDLVVATPSCRGGEPELARFFAGRQLLQAVRLIQEIRPRVVVLDIDPDYAPSASMSQLGERLLEAGYEHAWSVLDSVSFGATVSQQRLVFIGQREALTIRLPMPTHGTHPDLRPPRRLLDRLTRGAESAPVEHPFDVLHDFPDYFHWCGSLRTRARHIGQATAIPVAHAVAEAVRRGLEELAT